MPLSLSFGALKLEKGRRENSSQSGAARREREDGGDEATAIDANQVAKVEPRTRARVLGDRSAAAATAARIWVQNESV